MRRFVATLLVVASPAVLAAPVGATERRVAGPVVAPAAPAAMSTAPVTITPPAAPAIPPIAARPAAVVGIARAAVRPSVKAVRARALAPAAISDAAYAARLQAELCAARQIFCGLDRGGRYPAG